MCIAFAMIGCVVSFPLTDAPARDSRDLSESSARELRRKALLLLAVFLVLHFLMLTARSAVIDLQHQKEIAQSRLVLVPLGGVACYLILVLIDRLRGKGFLRQTLAGAFLSSIAAIVHAAVWAQILWNIDRQSYPSPVGYVAYQSFYWYLFYFAWTTAYLALCYSITAREQALRSAALLADAQEAKVRALRYQINPHFLFNTLNAIAQLVREDAAAAEDMVVNLSELFRVSLAIDPADDVSLAEEAAFQELYLRIEQVRFPNRLRFHIDVPADVAVARVPSLILQPLVENAVKHGVATSEHEVSIGISARRAGDRIIIKVADDARRSADTRLPVSGIGVGLANVRDRLAALYGDDHSLSAGPAAASGFIVELSLPFRAHD